MLDDIKPDPPHDIKAMNQALAGLTFVSSGPCPGCEDCGLADVYDTDTEEFEAAGEPYFGRHWCELCDSRHAGDRHPVHGRDPDDCIIHFDVCTDCLMAIQ